MSSTIHSACTDCKKEHCIGQMARGEAGGPGWVNVFAGPLGSGEDANHTGNLVRRKIDEIVKPEVTWIGGLIRFVSTSSLWNTRLQTASALPIVGRPLVSQPWPTIRRNLGGRRFLRRALSVRCSSTAW